MKRLISMLGAALVAAVMTLPSFAADAPKGFFEPAPVPLFQWSGFYAGINGGYGWGQSNWSAGSGSPAGGLIGGTIGFNVQTGAIVFGAEGDIDASWIRGTNSGGAGVCGGGACEFQNSWIATARGRVGYAFDRALFYVTAGGAFGDMQILANGLTQTTGRAGWTIGAGLEYEVLGPWSAKLEYLYVDLGDANCGAATCGVSTTVNFNTSIFRFGINYRFW